MKSKLIQKRCSIHEKICRGRVGNKQKNGVIIKALEEEYLTQIIERIEKDEIEESLNQNSDVEAEIIKWMGEIGRE